MTTRDLKVVSQCSNLEERSLSYLPRRIRICKNSKLHHHNNRRLVMFLGRMRTCDASPSRGRSHSRTHLFDLLIEGVLSIGNRNMIASQFQVGMTWSEGKVQWRLLRVTTREV